MMNLNCEDTIGRVVFNFISPRKTWHEFQDPGKSVLVDDRSVKVDGLSSRFFKNLIVIVLSFLRSGKVRLRFPIDRGNLIELLGMRCNKFVLIMEMLFSTEMRIP